MPKDEIVIELRDILHYYQDTLTKDVEQALKNLIDELEKENK